MFAVIVSEKGGGTERHDFNQAEVTVGRVQGNDIILPKGNVSKRHSRIVLKDGRFIVVDLKSTNGTYVNGRKVTSPLVVKPGDKIYIGDFTLAIETTAGTQNNVAARGSDAAPALTDERSPLPAGATPASPPMARAASQPLAPAHGEGRPATSDSGRPPIPTPPPPVMLDGPRVAPATSESARPVPRTWEPPKLDRVERTSESASSRSLGARGPLPEVASRGAQTRHTSAFEGVANVVGDRNLHAVMSRLGVEFDVHDGSADALRDESRWNEAERAAERVVQRLVTEGALDEGDAAALTAAAMREAVGLGPLEALLADERVREVLVSGPSQVYADFGEGLEPSGSAFSDGRALMTVIRRLAASGGVFLDKQATTHAFALASGANVALILPPMAVNGPLLEVRRVHRAPTLDELVASHAMSHEVRAAIVRAVHARKTLAVVGPAGSGVTSTLAAVAGAVAPTERFVVASVEPDLRLDHAHVVTLAAGVGPQRLRFRDVIEQALRLRSDRLIVDGLSSDDLRLMLARLGGRSPGDLLGIRLRSGDAPLAAMRRLLELGGAPSAEADLLLESSLGVVVELDGDHGVRRVRRVAELRRGATGLELVDVAV